MIATAKRCNPWREARKNIGNYEVMILSSGAQKKAFWLSSIMRLRDLISSKMRYNRRVERFLDGMSI